MRYDLFVQNESHFLCYTKFVDTRTHVVVELYDTERSYVDSLQILVMKYLQPLKSPENAGLVDGALVDEIFYQREVYPPLRPELLCPWDKVPAILSHHEVFLEELRRKLEQWDTKQTVGDVFLEVFTRQPLIETYTSFINNWKSAKEAIKATCHAKPAFARFLDAMAREHKGKLALDHLLIMPVQRIPRYELLMQRLLKHTDPSHPDHQILLDALREVHDLAVKINCTERESLELEQQQQTLKEIEGLIEGLINLVTADRSFLRHDLVTMASGQGTKKERVIFLFSDLLIITSIKRRTGTIRKPSTNCPGSVTSLLEANKYKLLMRIPLDDLEVVKAKDENLRRMLREMEHLAEDVATLTQVSELVSTLHCPHSHLEESVREMLSALNKQLQDRQTSDSQLSYLELTVNTQNGIENISIVFTKPEKRTIWEESFNEAKQKLALSTDRRPCPEFISPLPIRKTRAGLQFTCAAPTLGLNAYNMRDVWVCNSDGYVGQVCVLSLQPEPTVVSCNGVCNARILCVASIPAGVTRSPQDCAPGQVPLTNSKTGISISVEDTDKSGGNIQLDSSSSSEDDDDDGESVGPVSSVMEDEQKRVRSVSDSLASDAASEDADNLQPTMWLGTEDGCIHVYNCSDNIRIKKNKVKIQHGSSVHCIIYLDNRVFVSLANGDITVYVRDHSGWNTTDPYIVSVGTAATPVTRMLPIAGRLWCSCHNAIKILNTSSLQVETRWGRGRINASKCPSNISRGGTKGCPDNVTHPGWVTNLQLALLNSLRCCLALSNGRKKGLPIGACKHERQWPPCEPLERGVFFGTEYSGEIITDGSENMNCGAVQAVERVVGAACASAEERYKDRLNSEAQQRDVLQTHSFHVNVDSSRSVSCIAVSGLGVWISLQNSAVIRLFHATTYECLCDSNMAPAVTKMLSSCDDIIRQHKAACLRVTSLLACKDLLWVGTSAGVVLTMPLPHVAPSTMKINNIPTATGVPHGHTGHVRFLTFVETAPATVSDTLMVRPNSHHRYSLKSKPELQSSSVTNNKLLVISGGDGYEDFRTTGVSEVAGREDSTNHLLLWHV
uniref:DH domain-containing protein n=1 Tax=Timema douglasi TaxID=61478 RepID=A0A7R8VR50_TIMDO|nr:unnamed protein product [Timema douglasi]